MLIRKPTLALVTIAACLSAGSCFRRKPAEDIRLLLLPMENQTAEESLNWLSAVSSAVLDYDLNLLPHWVVLRGESVRNIADTQVNRVLSGYFLMEGGKLAVHATLSAPLERKTLRVMVKSGPPSAGLQPLLDAIAKELNAAARPFSSNDPAALQSYGQALQSSDPAARLRLLETATTQDPKLSAAGMALAQFLLERGDRLRAADAASRAARSATDPTDRARLEYLAATAQGDYPAREKALRKLATLVPSANTYALLGEMHTTARQFEQALQDYQEVARLEPQNGGVYNFIGYLYAYLHDLDGAKKNLERYASTVAPNDPNALDSLGEVHYLLGKFGPAERYFIQAFEKNPGAANSRELIKAAVSRLMTGDLPGADGLFRKYLDVVKTQDPQIVEIPQAQWEYFTGRRKQAFERLEKVYAAQNAESFALAGVQLAFWHLLTGDHYSATIYSANAKNRANNPAIRNLALICQYLAKPDSATPPDRWLQAMSLVLQHPVTASIPALEEVYRETPPATDADVRALLAWAYGENKQESAAAPLVNTYALIFPFPDAIFSGFTFPRFLQARAQVLRSPQLQRFAEQMAGDVPDRF